MRRAAWWARPSTPSSLFFRYGQLLCRRRVGDDAGRGAEGQAAENAVRRFQGFQSDGRPAEPFSGTVAAAHQAAGRGPACAARQTDYIDVYYIHHVDIQTPLEEMLRAFDDLVRQGKILYTACSNYETWRLMNICPLAQRYKRLGALRCLPAAIQPGGARHRRGDRAGLPGQGPGSASAWSPLAGGYLAGQYKPGQPESRRHALGRRLGGSTAASSRPTTARSCRRFWTPRARSTRSPAQTALRWVMDQPCITSAIVGARNTPARSARRWGAGGWRLPAAALGKLEPRRPSRIAIRAASRGSMVETPQFGDLPDCRGDRSRAVFPERRLAEGAVRGAPDAAALHRHGVADAVRHSPFRR